MALSDTDKKRGKSAGFMIEILDHYMYRASRAFVIENLDHKKY